MVVSSQRSKNDRRRTKYTSYTLRHKDTALHRYRMCQQLVVCFLLVLGLMWSAAKRKQSQVHIHIFHDMDNSLPFSLLSGDFQWLYSNLSFCTERCILIVNVNIVNINSFELLPWDIDNHNDTTVERSFVSSFLVDRCRHPTTWHTHSRWVTTSALTLTLYLTHITFCFFYHKFDRSASERCSSMLFKSVLHTPSNILLPELCFYENCASTRIVTSTRVVLPLVKHTPNLLKMKRRHTTPHPPRLPRLLDP